MKKFLVDLANKQSSFVELRYHKRISNKFMATKGRVDVANHAIVEGVGVRAYINGSWGFAATADCTELGIQKAINQSQQNALLLAKVRHGKDIPLRVARLSKATYIGPGYEALNVLSLSDKLGQIVEMEKKLSKSSSQIHTATCNYSEIFEEKIIVTSDGAEASLKIALPEFRLSAIAEKDGLRSTSTAGAGVSGDWKCLFAHPALENVIEETAQRSIDLLKAKYPEGGKKTCILSPSVVGLLCHEAIGHTVEADFVKTGSVAAGKIGKRVASDLVSMADTGMETLAGYAVGNMPFDDEGVETETTMIIKDGIMNSYLHNRQTAEEFGVNPTGNARAWLFKDEPIIRMRNTYFLPGKSKLQTMIEEIDDGYLVDGEGGGQADSNGEFMFGTGWVWRIKDGKKVELLKEATLSGIAFDVLQTVDAVSEEFMWDLGTGYCGKGQPAKVDAGGPYVRCKITVGGQQ